MCQTQNYIKILGQTREPNSSPVNINTLAAQALGYSRSAQPHSSGKKTLLSDRFFFIKGNSSPAKNSSFLIRSYSIQLVFSIPDNTLQLSL